MQAVDLMNICPVSSGWDSISFAVSKAYGFITRQLIGILNEFGPPLYGQGRVQSGGGQISGGPKIITGYTGKRINRTWPKHSGAPEAEGVMREE